MHRLYGPGEAKHRAELKRQRAGRHSQGRERAVMDGGGAGRRLNWQSCRLAREQLRQLGEVRGEWRECGASRQSEVKPDGESQSVGCSTRARDTRANGCPGVYLLVPCRSLQHLIADFASKVLFVGLVDGFLIHDTKSHHLCRLTSLSTIAPQRRFATDPGRFRP